MPLLTPEDFQQKVPLLKPEESQQLKLDIASIRAILVKEYPDDSSRFNDRICLGYKSEFDAIRESIVGQKPATYEALLSSTRLELNKAPPKLFVFFKKLQFLKCPIETIEMFEYLPSVRDLVLKATNETLKQQLEACVLKTCGVQTLRLG